MVKEYGARFDLRVEPELKKLFQKYCKEKKLKLSEAGRDALETYVASRNFIDAILENLQNPDFHKSFSIFYESLSDSVKGPLDSLLGPEEEKLIKSTPEQLLKNLKVITKKGQKVLNDMV